MKAQTLAAVTLLAALINFSGAARAELPEPIDWMVDRDGCHVLLTEHECAAYRAALEAMPSIAQRYAYLDAQGISLRDREAMCSCKRNPPATAHYPQGELKLARR